MAHHNQINFIRENKDLIQEPILLVGSRLYDYDRFELAAELKKMGFIDITGTDIEDGPGVDFVVDISDRDSDFLQTNRGKYATVVCMEVLTHIKNPFDAAFNVSALSRPGAIVILSEVFVRKLSHMPYDFWRFSYEGLKMLFSRYNFWDERSRYSITRQRDGALMVFPGVFEAIMKDERHHDETRIGFFLRRFHRKFFAKGIFRISRLMPEQTVYAIGKLK